MLWLWCRPAATAQIRPLAWEPPYAVGGAKEIATKTTTTKKKRQKKNFFHNLQSDKEKRTVLIKSPFFKIAMGRKKNLQIV